RERRAAREPWAGSHACPPTSLSACPSTHLPNRRSAPCRSHDAALSLTLSHTHSLCLCRVSRARSIVVAPWTHAPSSRRPLVATHHRPLILGRVDRAVKVSRVSRGGLACDGVGGGTT